MKKQIEKKKLSKGVKITVGALAVISLGATIAIPLLKVGAIAVSAVAGGASATVPETPKIVETVTEAFRTGGKHAHHTSPIEHIRSSFIRTLKSGKKVHVRSAVVNPGK